MGHFIQGFIAKTDELKVAALRLTGASCVPLNLGYSFLPISDAIAEKTEDVPIATFYRLTKRLIEWAEFMSSTTPLAYIETEYHGGTGTQSSIVWSIGRCVLGPLETSNGVRESEASETSLHNGAINRALRRIGVERGTAQDEFDALRLGWNRTNEDWLNESDANTSQT